MAAAFAGEGVGLEQQRQPLDLGEAAAVEQHGPGQGLELGPLVGDAAGRRSRAPALRPLDQVPAPVGAAVDPARREAGVEAVGDTGEALGLEAKHRGGALGAGGAADDDPLAGSGPLADPLRPGLGVAPARRGAGGDLFQHQQLGAVHVPEHRRRREGPRRRLVQRGQVVQVEEVGVAGPGQLHLAGPGVDLDLVGDLADAGDDRVLGAKAVLVGAVHRRRPGAGLEAEPVGAAQRRREVDRPQVEPGVEARRQRVLAEIRARAGEHGDLELVALELARQRPADVGGAAAGIEIDTHQQLCRCRWHLHRDYCRAAPGRSRPPGSLSI